LKTGVKFCGGCNPRYDRKAFLKKIEKSMTGYRFTYNLEEEYDILLIICGCKSACAKCDNKGKKTIIVDNLSETEEIIRQLKLHEGVV
jgi:hypothetical protein